MDQLASQLGSAELQALIAALPHDLTINSGNTSKATSVSTSDLSTSTSSSCIFPQLNDMTALSLLSLSAYPSMFPGFPLLSSLPYLNGTLPPHSTIESLGLINSALYQQQKDVHASMTSPMNSLTVSLASDGRPRAYSSAATLQHSKDHEKRRKRSRKPEFVPPPTTNTITCSTSSSPANSAMSSVLRTLVEDDDVHPNKVRPIQVTKEEEELVRRKTQELLKSVPLHQREEVPVENGPLRRLIRDEDLPDEVGPDSPFRHYPKYQVHNKSPLNGKTDDEIAAIRLKQKGQSLDDLVNETVRQELIAAE
uniref:Uncharacterized protein n=1 Tax=Caenorhabditis japonica TaxID=281687 RepID=A0A8R1HLX3_CAEJA